MTVQTWPGARKAWTRQLGALRMASMAGGNEYVGHQQREVLKPLVRGLPDGHGVGGRGGLEAHGEEHHLALRIIARDLEGVEWRIDDADVAAGGLGVQQAARGTGDAQHVAEGAEDGLGARGDLHRFIDQLDGGHANRAAGTVNQGDLGRQQVLEAALENGVGLAAADFHDGPGAMDDAPDLAGEQGDRRAFAILVEELHAGPS